MEERVWLIIGFSTQVSKNFGLSCIWWYLPFALLFLIFFNIFFGFGTCNSNLWPDGKTKVGKLVQLDWTNNYHGESISPTWVTCVARITTTKYRSKGSSMNMPRALSLDPCIFVSWRKRFLQCSRNEKIIPSPFLLLLFLHYHSHLLIVWLVSHVCIIGV